MAYKLTAKERRALIGKKVEWEYGHDHYRGTYNVRSGIVEASEGRNLLVDGDWMWYPDMKNLKEVDEE